jgi:hypothetical protein
MSKRLQVLLSEDELSALQSAAAAESVPVGEWVRRAIREKRDSAPRRSVEEKLRALREMSRMNLPTCDIDQMNAEIEAGYLSGPFPE